MGSRESGYGSYVLYNAVQNKTILRGQLERPNSGRVANNGYFSLEDWGFSGSGLSGVFYVLYPSGEIIIKRRFEANIYNSAISNEGKLAVCQTCHNPSGSDGNLLTLFDLTKKTELFSVHPIEQWAEKYDFLEDQQILIVTLKDIGEFRYDKFGTFLDYATYNSARLTSKNYGVILRAAHQFLKDPDLDQKRIETILNAILRARTLGANSDQGNKLFALKIQGFTLEALGREREALAVYEEAIKIDPKIGVKRKADALKKKLG
jgi:tetratricopeptide (TPR) repeat protein